MFFQQNRSSSFFLPLWPHQLRPARVLLRGCSQQRSQLCFTYTLTQAHAISIALSQLRHVPPRVLLFLLWYVSVGENRHIFETFQTRIVMFVDLECANYSAEVSHDLCHYVRVPFFLAWSAHSCWSRSRKNRYTVVQHRQQFR